MRPVLVALALSLIAVPAFPGNVIVDLPHLTWPQGDQISPSTEGCKPVSQPATCRLQMN